MFVHLHVHSHYSFLRGGNAPGDYIAAAARMKMPAVALTDSNGLYGAIPFYREAVAGGVKPILGVELQFTPPDSAACPLPEPPEAGCIPSSLILLATTNEGYSNLCRLTTQMQMGDPGVRIAELARHSSGLVALSHALRPLPALKEIFGRNLYVEARATDGPRAVRAALAAARSVGVRAAATGAVHFCAPEDHLTHRVLAAVREGVLLSKLAPEQAAPATAWLQSPEAMAKIFGQDEAYDALRATLDIAAQVDVRFKFGELRFPDFEMPPGETAFSRLWKLCFEGAARRYRPITSEVISRLHRELEVIQKRNLSPYFLIVWDIVRQAAEMGIPTVGRGSAASSLAAYCLGITSICPIRHDLCFERFLNEHREDYPDIDLDICGRRRDELLDYVYKKYGEARVAMISSFITMQSRLAVREVGKVFGLNPAELNDFCRRLPHRPVAEIQAALATLPECRNLPVHEEPYRTVLEVARRLDNFPRHLGIHPCGTVISRTPLTDLVPLETATKGIVVTQYDMHAIEALGLIKMDLLGQRALTTMSDVVGPGGQPGFWEIPENDRKTLDLVRTGRTMGVFQIESPGMRGLLRAVGAKTLEEICLTLALIRPGAAEYGSKDLFLKRFRGEAPVEYLHPTLEPILKESLGVCIYQEQVLRIAQAVAGVSLHQADLLRRLMTHQRSHEEMERFHQEFTRSAAIKGIAAETIEHIWQTLAKFAGFGFCKAHAATYADMAYRLCYLKAHRPAEFMAAVCSSGAGFYHPAAYVEESKRLGLAVLLPCVNRSEVPYTADGKSLRIGLMQIKNLSAKTMDAILGARQSGGVFTSLNDFLWRVDAEQAEVESLIKCGAMDCFENSRPELLWKLDRLYERILRQKRVGAGELFPMAKIAPETILPRLPNYTPEKKLEVEQEVLEVFASGHPLDGVKRKGEVLARRIPEYVHRTVSCLGWLITWRRVGTKDLRNMMFLTLEDKTAVFEAVLFPEAYQKYGSMVFDTRLFRVTGRVERDGQLNCSKLEAPI